MQSSIIVVNQTYQERAKEFLDHLLMLGHSSHGAKCKTRFLKEFLHFCEVNGIQELQAITAPTINDYYAYIVERPNKITGEKLSLKTAYNHTRSIELFFIMLQTKGESFINPTSTLTFPYPSETEQTRNVLTQEEIKELYNHCKDFLEKAILSLAYGCGLRVSEMVQCNIDDIKLRENILIVPAGKFNKRRVIPMSTGVVKDLENYFYQVRIQQEPKDYKAFMLHVKGGRIRKWTFNKYLKKIIERTQNKTIIEKNITIHNLRHSIATHLLENKIPLEQVRMFLGHNQLETTEVYTHCAVNYEPP
jgi:integrase/recombinase XerD